IYGRQDSVVSNQRLRFNAQIIAPYGITGSLEGTISSASFATTASFVDGVIASASYAQTASFASNVPDTASFAVSASFATSASWAPPPTTVISASYANTASVAEKIPVGTEAQRPSPGERGMVRLNTTTNIPEWYDAVNDAWRKFGQNPVQVEYMAIGGGGGGGNSDGGGPGG
ncbi:MAG: hypothetical protein ACK55Z_01530, partial [bacterium]